jgi:hypothetical protein
LADIFDRIPYKPKPDLFDSLEKKKKETAFFDSVDKKVPEIIRSYVKEQSAKNPVLSEKDVLSIVKAEIVKIPQKVEKVIERKTVEVVKEVSKETKVYAETSQIDELRKEIKGIKKEGDTYIGSGGVVLPNFADKNGQVLVARSGQLKWELPTVASSLTIGDTISDGTPTCVLFVKSDGTLGQDSSFTYSSKVLSISNGLLNASFGQSGYAGYFTDGTKSVYLAESSRGVSVQSGGYGVSLIDTNQSFGAEFTDSATTVRLCTPGGIAAQFLDGNVGIGTPSPVTLLEIPGSTSNSSAKFGSFELQSYAINNSWLGENAYYNGSAFKYRANGYGVLNYYANGGWQIRTAPSGTAGNTATFTEVLTLLNNGNLGLSNTNPTTAKLVIGGTAATTGIDLSTNDQYLEARVIRNSLNAGDKDLYFNFLAGATSSIHLYSDNSEAVTLKAGKLGVGGVTGPTEALDVAGLVKLTNGAAYNATIYSGDVNWGFKVQRTAATDDYNVRMSYAAGSGTRKCGIYDVSTGWVAYGDASATPNFVVVNKLVVSSILNTGTLTLPTSTDTLIARATTDTLTNKRITARISTTASSATPTPNADTDDEYTVTALAAGATFGAPSGTPTNGQKLIIRVKDNGTIRALAWNGIYRAGTSVALPTTTTLSKTLYVGFIYNSTDSKWDLMAYTDGYA